MTIGKGRQGRRWTVGFTLIELMLVVAVVGLLSAIAIPKFANLVTKSKEAAVRGKLGSLRSAWSIYYANNEGRYPFDPTIGYISINFRDVLNVYLPDLRDYQIQLPNVHPGTGLAGTVNMPNLYEWGEVVAGVPIVWWANSRSGALKVSCAHTDSTGHLWSLY